MKKKIKTYSIIVAIAAVLLIGVAYYFHGNNLLNVVTYEKPVAEAQVVEKKVNCTDGVSMYTEECVKKMTDNLAEAFVEMTAQEKVVQKEIEKLDRLREDYNDAVFGVEAIMN